MAQDTPPPQGSTRMGDKSRFYAGDDTRHNGPERRLSPSEEEIREMLLAFDSELQERVEWAFKQWNPILRDYMRNDTALRLSVGTESQAVAVRITDGMPSPLLNVIAYREAEVFYCISHSSRRPAMAFVLLRSACNGRCKPGRRSLAQSYLPKR
jgi:hypothetical protein